MNKISFRNKFINIVVIILSILAGVRIFDLFLDLNDSHLYKNFNHIKKLKNGSELYISHEEGYDISSKGKDTIIFIGDSFGEGVGCGNEYNVAGCLSRIYPNRKIVNLSKGGTSPAYYKNQLEKYLSNERNKNFKGETVFISLYSNDIIIDNNTCNYFDLNKLKLKREFNNDQFQIINNVCKPIISEDSKEFIKSNSFRIPYSKQLIKLFGLYSFLFFREIAAQVSLQFYDVLEKVNDSQSFGRASYVPKWSNFNSAEFLLVSNIIKDIAQLCQEKNCNVKFVFFPNVENLSPNSKIRSSFILFANYMKSNFDINIYDGYLPFIKRGIKSAKYSYTNIHSNCEGYMIFASYLSQLLGK